jgi:hypothetical protein
LIRVAPDAFKKYTILQGQIANMRNDKPITIAERHRKEGSQRLRARNSNGEIARDPANLAQGMLALFDLKGGKR